MSVPDKILPEPSALAQALQIEGEKFQEYYKWLEDAMPKSFFDEVTPQNLMLITHNLIGFHLQDFFSTINLKTRAITLCLDTPGADIRVLQDYALYGIKNYQAYISKIPPPFPGITAPLRITTIDFTDTLEDTEKTYPPELKAELRNLLRKENPEITDEEFEHLISKVRPRFLLSLPTNRLALAFHMLYRAQTRDYCQYEVRYVEENNSHEEHPSLNIVLAWKNTPRYQFLYRLANVVYRHGLRMSRVNATYTDPYSPDSILLMALTLHGSNDQAVDDIADIPDFLRELATVKYFDTSDIVNSSLVSKGIISGNMGNFVRSMVIFIHQCLVHLDSHLYTFENVEEALCRHPELTEKLCQSFKLKFDPQYHNYEEFQDVKNEFLEEVNQLDTGHEENDMRRKNVLRQGMNFISHVLKTNFFRLNYSAICFRLDPKYLDEIPFDRAKKFPEIPYAIFFTSGMHFFSFHIRFKDLSRGGLRTVYPEQMEQMIAERNNIFTECYNLSLTQHKKNKDIPEGGAKGVIFLKPFTQIDLDSEILKKELERDKVPQDEIDQKVIAFRETQKLEYLYQAQRAFIESLITIVNCDPDGKVRAKYIVDYWKRPEYIYLGPDEYMHDSMIQWIANYSKKYHYKPGGAFISSKPITGINHKEYGVTSLGVNVYMHKVLEYLAIQPEKDTFTIKMSGGPDGDVAGNQLLNLYHHYPHTAKVIALTDKTGTIYEENGLDLAILRELFYQAKGIRFYPPKKLSPGGFLLDKDSKRYPAPYVKETLCYKNINGKLTEEWLSGSEANHLLRFNVHKTKTDIFIPAGGRPRTLNELNVKDFLDETGKPTSKAIIEGANLYLTPGARYLLEQKGVLIVKDSSANKTGVICSSFEVLCGLALNDRNFIDNKNTIVTQILQRLKECAENEANLLIKTHNETNEYLTDISEKISEKINQYKFQILDYLNLIPLPRNFNDQMIRCFLAYCLPILKDKFPDALLEEIPDHHKKAIIACYIASQMVYNKGVSWSPSIVDILPLILSSSIS